MKSLQFKLTREEGGHITNSCSVPFHISKKFPKVLLVSAGKVLAKLVSNSHKKQVLNYKANWNKENKPTKVPLIH